MNQIEAVDSFIIDRVFQPVCDRMAWFVSCYGAAAFILTGALFATLVADFALHQWVSLFLTPVWLPAAIWRAYRLEESKPTNVLPIEQPRWLIARAILLLVAIDVLITIGAHVIDGALWKIIEGASWWGIFCGFYLMACRRNPPRQQQSLAPVWSGV